MNQKKPSNPRVVLESTAIRFLSFRPRFRSEVVNKLAQKAAEIGLSDPLTLIDQITNSLENSKFIDDNALLERYIHANLVDRKRGPAWIRTRLLRFGLRRPVIEAALKQFAPRQAQIAAITSVIVRSGNLDQAGRARLYRRLLGRGFSHELISAGFDQKLPKE